MRADALNDAGKLDEAITSVSAALRGMDAGYLADELILTAWIIARDHAASQAIATAWLEAYLEVENAPTAPLPSGDG